jgi:hypothetical protein
VKAGQTAWFSGAVVKAHVEDMVDCARWKRTQRRSGHRWLCGSEMTGLGFRGSDTIKKSYVRRYRLKKEFRTD